MRKTKESKQILRCFILNEAEYNMVINLINAGLSVAKMHHMNEAFKVTEDLLNEFVNQCEMQGGF